MHPLYQLLTELESARLPFTIGRYRPDTVMITVTLVGERVEIDVFDDGHMEVSRFVGDEGVVGGIELVRKLIQDNRE
jgi:hypothetical protein